MNMEVESLDRKCGVRKDVHIIGVIGSLFRFRRSLFLYSREYGSKMCMQSSKLFCLSALMLKRTV